MSFNRAGDSACPLGSHVVCNGDIGYARRQMEVHAARNRTGVCHLDADKKCAIAWKCGFAHRIDCCVTYVKRRNIDRSHSVPANCSGCSKFSAGIRLCDWKCCLEKTETEKQPQAAAKEA